MKSISRLFEAQSLADNGRVRLTPDNSHYVKHVLRLKHGELVALFNGQDHCDYVSRLSYQGKQALASIEQRVCQPAESELCSHIIQGLSRADHLDWMIQKTTELGISQISVFNATHSQIPLKPAHIQKRLAHWRAIAIKACEQCGRHMPPQIDFYPGLNQALASAEQHTVRLLLDFDGDSIKSVAPDNCAQVSILVGPEGGFAASEIKLAKDNGFIPVRLGPRILRTETAATAALAIIQTLSGNI